MLPCCAARNELAAARGRATSSVMRRRSAAGVGIVLALAAAGGAAAISRELAGERRGERHAYAAALAEREAAAAGAEGAPGAARAAAPAAGSRTLCLRGADTVVARVARFLDARVVDDSGRLDVSALARTSRRAAEVDRSASVPQRMGRQRGPVETGTGGARPAPWQPIDPPDRICVELAELSSHGKRRAAGGAK